MTKPVSAPRRKSDKQWRNALERALARVGGKEGVIGGLDQIADQVVAAAKDGDKDAWKEIGDRVDGKAVQHTEGSLDINIHDGARDKLRTKLDRLAVPEPAQEPAGKPH